MTSAKLDSMDRKMLRQLQANARLTNQELSEKVGLSPSPCLRRLRRLESEGIITGYSAILDEEKLGLPVAIFMSVKLERQIDSALVAFETEIMKHPEVIDCWLMTGDNDYLLRVLTSGLKEYETFLTGTLTKIPGIASIQSSVSLRRVKSSASGIV
ncbi:Lrp/AsnC family leucine-responsive transcriptional regulator [Mesorhizobium robiniae]|uniref:Lrp/AsnC family leucine-responsive transcriptional regulator n=1 Tax=Mesorhizobium robiniae TaxID=559315 RepID=A0ABV2GZZ7_9HYPH|nr:Lrp/AsnC family transcriptional regulator [Mesorhizobium sp. ZC-5]MCV3244122.1 Lrp/AsnC family transcriptional regulator [Mesorhizobium sp. ZC-5]